MNRRGFTLIELLAVIVIIGIMTVITVPNILNMVDDSKQASYNTLIKNIVTSSQMYYEECEYGDLSDDSKYVEYACTIIIDKEVTYIDTTLGKLANTGFLTVSDTKEGKKVVINPINDQDISDCPIRIKKIIDNNDNDGIKNYKVTYKIENTSKDNICPKTYE